jgi:hypothetical protein
MFSPNLHLIFLVVFKENLSHFMLHSSVVKSFLFKTVEFPSLLAEANGSHWRFILSQLQVNYAYHDFTKAYQAWDSSTTVIQTAVFLGQL